MAVLLVLVAMVLGTVSQLLPLVEQHPDRVAAWLGQRTGRVIAFDEVRTEWTRRGPLLELDNLRVGEGSQAFTIGDAEMLVSIYAGLLPGGSFSELRLRGLDLTLERASDGRWQVRGLPGQRQAGGDPLAALEGLGELQVIDGELAVLAPMLGIDAHVPRIDLRLRVEGDRVRAGVRAWPTGSSGRDTSGALDGQLDFNRATGDGTAYVGSRRAQLEPWSPLLQLAGVSVGSGAGRAEAWAELRHHRIAMVTVEAALDDVVLKGSALDAHRAPPQRQFEHIQTGARWHLTADGWRLDAPRLRFTDASVVHQLDGLLIAGGDRFGVLAERIRVGPLLSVAALSDRLPPPLRRWLHAADPDATVRDLRIIGRRGGPMVASANFESLQFAPANGVPGIKGLAGRVQGDAHGFALEPDPAARMLFDWPTGFAAAKTITLRGPVIGWRDGEGWRLGTPALRLAGKGYGTDIRGGLRWEGDGSRPRIDLAATVDDADLTLAREFWLNRLMAPKLIEWLDGALLAGTVRDGRVLVSGDLDQWPFDGTAGRLEASATVTGGKVRYRPDWPVVENIDADLAFFGTGFTVEGAGSTAGVRIKKLQAGVDRYRGGTLRVHASGGSNAGELLELLRQTPLRKVHAETFDSLGASGPAVADFDFMLPLRPDSAAVFGGVVRLSDARLADRRWKLAFDRVSGRIDYGRSGFRAEELRARHEGQQGRLALRAGAEYVRDRANVFEAGLEVALSADEVLDRAPDLAWLKPHVEGRSGWTVGVVVPRRLAGEVATARLKMNSNLVGTELTLPAPLRKPAAMAIAATIDTPLPLGSGEVRVGLGELMALRARSSKGNTGVRMVLGSSRVEQAPPASGLVATGKAEILDALDWISLVHGGGSGAGAAMPLQRIDVTAGQLRLLGGSFADARLLVLPATRGATSVRVEGSSLAGALTVPGDRAAAVVGRFERVHWRSSERVPAAGAQAAHPHPETAGEARMRSIAGRSVPPDPSRIPPLSFDVQDLRVGEARLGVASIRTQPTAAGMRIQQLQTRAPGQTIQLSGDWTGRGDEAITRVAMELDSGDFGALLGGLGHGGRLAGGEGKVRFDTTWPGSPADFALGGLNGSLRIAARDGRLLELEPGAGRVLGLLSLAELPRRLSLDFRDFFDKGLAFNRLDGTLHFSGGNARSDDLVIDAPAAVISIRGVADLRTQRFNQTVEVRPKSANLLTAVGAIAGGPVGAAIGAAANAVLQKPLGQMGTKLYRVTGPWSEPKVEVISRDRGRIPADPIPAAG